MANNPGLDKDLEELKNKKKNEEKTKEDNQEIKKDIIKKDNENPTITLPMKEEEKLYQRTYMMSEKAERKLEYISEKSGKDKSKIIRIAINFLSEHVEFEKNTQ